VDTQTHAIVHLEHAIKMQDLELEERAAKTTTLDQQLQVVQIQVPQALEAPVEPDAMLDVDEE
jgi:hypothetical protein